MKKRRIVIASVLKPIDDTRMYEKMGASLSLHDAYEIFIIGQASNAIPAHQGIHFIPLKRVKRVSLQRFLLPFIIGIKVIQVRPELLIVNTHELLIVSMLNRILFGCRIVYDIRENHYRNIRFSEAFPILLRAPIALWVRMKEKLTAPLFHHFILAEKAYQNELTFIGNRFTILENKAVLATEFVRPKSDLNFRLLFSGTIARSTGIFEAIALAKSLHTLNRKITLTIVGYCALDQQRKEILEAIGGASYVHLKGFEELVPHREVVEEITKASFGIVYYPPAPHTLGSVPTKLYEYIAHQLPILTWPDQTFTELIVEHQAGMLINNGHETLLENMESHKFYPKPVDGAMWEAQKFDALITKLLG